MPSWREPFFLPCGKPIPLFVFIDCRYKGPTLRNVHSRQWSEKSFGEMKCYCMSTESSVVYRAKLNCVINIWNVRYVLAGPHPLHQKRGEGRLFRHFASYSSNPVSSNAICKWQHSKEPVYLSPSPSLHPWLREMNALFPTSHTHLCFKVITYEAFYPTRSSFKGRGWKTIYILGIYGSHIDSSQLH